MAIDTTTPESEANAHLIEQAPALLAALKGTLRALGAHLAEAATGKGVKVADLCPCYDTEVQAARAAIAAAEGRDG